MNRWRFVVEIIELTLRSIGIIRHLGPQIAEQWRQPSSPGVTWSPAAWAAFDRRRGDTRRLARRVVARWRHRRRPPAPAWVKHTASWLTGGRVPSHPWRAPLRERLRDVGGFWLRRGGPLALAAEPTPKVVMELEPIVVASPTPERTALEQRVRDLEILLTEMYRFTTPEGSEMMKDTALHDRSHERIDTAYRAIAARVDGKDA